MDQELEYKVFGLIGSEEDPLSPEIEPPDLGIGINIKDLVVMDGKVEFVLLLTACFDEAFYGSFQRIHWAPVLLIEDGVTGLATAFKTYDMHKRLPALNGPNFKKLVLDSSKERYRNFWLQVPLRISAVKGTFHPSLFITATLQSYLSNTMAIDLKKKTAISLKDGIPHEIGFASLPEVGQDSSAD